MLRHDNRRHREYKHNQSLAKAQLYVADHFYNPNNKLLCPENDEYRTVMPQDCVYSPEQRGPHLPYLVRNIVGSTNNVDDACHTTTSSLNRNSIGTSNSNHNNNNNSNVNTDVKIDIDNSGDIPGVHKYSYEKLRDSSTFDNACESVIVWSDSPKEMPKNSV